MSDTYVAVMILICTLEPTGAVPRPGLKMPRSMTRRDLECRDNTEYLFNGICCLNCPAGTHMKSGCTQVGKKGKCEECNFGTYTEFDNHLLECLKCTKCHSDQEIVRECTTARDTECQCKRGRFCDPDQACEVCKKCLTCGKDEVKERNCTATSNTVCKKVQPASESGIGSAAVIVPVVLFIAGLAIVVVVLWKKRRDRQRESERNPSAVLKVGQTDVWSSEDMRNRENGQQSHSCLIPRLPAVRSKSSARVEDEREELCSSLDSSASNSLSSLPCTAPAASLPLSSPADPAKRETEPFPTLVPVNGEASLRSCFEYFEDLDVDYYARFFRSLGIHDNVIKSKHGLPHEDRIHSLLNVWLEKEGSDASLNDLLQTLLSLNQRLTADKVKDRAVAKGLYVRAADTERQQQNVSALSDG